MCCQFEILHVTSLLPVVYCSEFAFLSFWNSYLFPLIICIISILSHVVDVTPTYWISKLKFVTNIGLWYLHPEILSPSFLAQAEVDSHMILLNFSHSSTKCIQLTYLKIAMSKPRCSLINQVLLCSFEYSYLYNSSENVPLLKYTWRYIWNRKISWSNNGWLDDRPVHCIFDADL